MPYQVTPETSIRLTVTEQIQREIIVESYEILKLAENFEDKNVRALVKFNEKLYWVTAFEGAAYEANIDYSQADLEAAITNQLKLGKYEG